MSNMSSSNDKVITDDEKVKLIIGEVGRDTKTGIIGRGYSFDNGVTFHVTDTIHGRLYDQSDTDGIWNNGLHDKVEEKVSQEIINTVEPAIKQADNAVKFANDAIEKSKVNENSIREINSAVSDAISDAAVAKSDGLRAWNAAQSNVNLIDLNYASASASISSARTEAIAAANEAKASASAAKADIVTVRSDVAAVQADVTATRSDVAVAKSAIADTKTSLTSQAKSLSSYAAQASANGADIVTLKSQAGQLEQDMADTKGDVSQLKVSASAASVALSDAAGNISSLQATAKSYSAALSDTNSNVASVTATASDLETKYADAAGDINKLQADASGTKQTLTNAKNDIAVLQSRADGFDTKLADTAGDINTLKANASGFSQTLVSAKGDISTLQATATGLKNTLTDAQGNISTLQSDVSGLKKTTSDNAGNIATLQADTKTLTSQMSSAQGNISTLQQTASGFSSKVSGMETSLANANSKIDAIQTNGGGVNLAKGTSSEDQSAGDASKTTGWQVPTIATFDNPQAGQQYTISVNTKNNGGSWHIQFWDGTSPTQRGKWLSSGNIFTSTQGQKHTATITWPSGSNKYLIVQLVNNNDGGQIFWNSAMLEEGTVAHDWSPAPEDTDAKITANTTAIEQNKQAIALKADQTTVDKINGTVNQLQSSLSVQAGQIQTKVSASDVSGMLTGYATQSYAQSLVTQKADDWNLNLTKLQTDVNAIKTTGGGVNLLTGTSGDLQTYSGSGWNSGNLSSTSLSLVPGQTYTAKMWIQGYDVPTRLVPRAYNGSGALIAYAFGNVIDANSSGYSTVTWTADSNWTSNVVATLSFTSSQSATHSGQYKEPMLEEGTVAHDWSPAPSDMATVTSVTNLSATVDGIKGLVETKADKSEVTQLSNLVQTKVSSGDFTSTTTQLKNMISQRVQVGDVISQINQEAGGNTLIQVSNGKGSLILDAGNTIITGKTWIPSAAIANLTADQVQAGTLSGSKVHAGDDSGNAIDMGVLSDNYVGMHAYANNGDHTYIDLNGIHNYGASYDTRIQQGKITTDYLTVNGGGMIDFRAGDAGVTMDNQDIKFYNSGDVNGGISFAGSNPIADRNSGSGNELRLRYDGSFALTPISDESTRLVASTKAMGFGYQQTGSTSPDVNLTGLWVNNSGRYVRIGSWNSNSKWSRAEFNSDGVNINHAGLSIGLKNNLIHMYMDGNYAATAIQLRVDGWAWINGYCEAMGFTQHSTLSTKTRIEKADPDHMLELINNTELTTFAFKSEVAEGTEVRHIGPIIDDVNDIAQYRTPAEFIAPTKTARDDDNMIGALFGAVQALTKRIKTLEEKIK